MGQTPAKMFNSPASFGQSSQNVTSQAQAPQMAPIQSLLSLNNDQAGGGQSLQMNTPATQPAKMTPLKLPMPTRNPQRYNSYL